MVVVLLPALMLTRWVTRPWNGRALVCTAAALLAGVAGFSRVYLGVHYLSDVAAGWLLGSVWAGTVALACGWRPTARPEHRTRIRLRQARAAWHAGQCRSRPRTAIWPARPDGGHMPHRGRGQAGRDGTGEPARGSRPRP